MEKEINSLSDALVESWRNFQDDLPSILIAFLVFMTGIYLIRSASKLVLKFIGEKSKDPLITDFLVNIVSFVLIILLVVLCLGILGWGSITNKILAGAGITTFVVGFALKDIGENFLAGIFMAFRRPFRIGDLVEVQKIRGRVVRMSLRETHIKTLDGRDVYMPNSIILKSPFENLTMDYMMRTEFSIHVILDNVEETMKKILDTVKSFEQVAEAPAPSVIIQEINDNRVTLKSLFWFKTTEVSAPGGGLRSNVLLKVSNEIKDKIYTNSSS
jgi:small-conductance mechanosensitive channel